MRSAWVNFDVIFPVLILVAAALVAGDTGGIASSVESSIARSAANTLTLKSDLDAQRLLSANKTEARQWLDSRNKSHVVWKWNTDAALGAVNELYRAGAKEISVVDASKLERGGEMASRFVIELSTEPVRRRKLFAWIERWERDAQFAEEDLTKDIGQRYYVLDTDH